MCGGGGGGREHGSRYDVCDVPKEHPIWNPYMLLKSEQSFKPWEQKIKIPLYPKILFYRLDFEDDAPGCNDLERLWSQCNDLSLDCH